MKRTISLAVFLLFFSGLSYADWFTSSKTKELIEKADAGDKDAQFAVGSAYDFGTGAPRDGEKAAKYYLMAAEQGHTEAQNSLGSGYEAEGNYTDAASWYFKAAQQNHPLAMNSLAIYYLKGVGVPLDKDKGIELYTKVANLGFPNAMYNLGIQYLSGEFIEKDASKACIWFYRAYVYGEKVNYKKVIEESSKAKEVIQKKYLNKDELAKCEQEATSWTPTRKTQNP